MSEDCDFQHFTCGSVCAGGSPPRWPRLTNPRVCPAGATHQAAAKVGGGGSDTRRAGPALGGTAGDTTRAPPLPCGGCDGHHSRRPLAVPGACASPTGPCPRPRHPRVTAMFPFTSSVAQCGDPDPVLSAADRACRWGGPARLRGGGRGWAAAAERSGGFPSASGRAARTHLPPGRVPKAALTAAPRCIRTDAVLIYYLFVGCVCTHLQTPAFENVLHSCTLERSLP